MWKGAKHDMARERLATLGVSAIFYATPTLHRHSPPPAWERVWCFWWHVSSSVERKLRVILGLGWMEWREGFAGYSKRERTSPPLP